MQIALAAIAIIIFLLYSVYFYYIIRSRPEHFERLMLTTMADWMIAHKQDVPRQMGMLLVFSLLLEVGYFTLVFLVINNPVFRVITGIFAAFEAFHLLRFALAMHQFFSGIIPLKELFNWKVERVSAWLFFTHALLVLVQLAVWW